MTGLQQAMRLTVTIGIFSDSGGTYTGRVGGVGNVGYTVNDIAAGQLLFSGRSFYEVTASTVITPNSVAEITVEYLAGTDNVPTPPQTGRGQITASTPNMGLPLPTQTGSQFTSPEFLAKLLAHAFLIIDAGAVGSSIYGEYFNDTAAALGGVPLNGLYSLSDGNDYGMAWGIVKRRTE